MAALDTLLDILGASISRREGERLLSDAGGDVSSAVAAFFSAQSADLGPGPSSAAQSSGANGALAQLRSILGREPSDAQLNELLNISRGSVEAAIELYLENPNAGRGAPAGGGGAGPSSGARGGGGGAAARQGPGVHRAGSEPINLADSDDEGARRAAAAAAGAGPRAAPGGGPAAAAANGAAAAGQGAERRVSPRRRNAEPAGQMGGAPPPRPPRPPGSAAAAAAAAIGAAAGNAEPAAAAAPPAAAAAAAGPAGNGPSGGAAAAPRPPGQQQAPRALQAAAGPVAAAAAARAAAGGGGGGGDGMAAAAAGRAAGPGGVAAGGAGVDAASADAATAAANAAVAAAVAAAGRPLLDGDMLNRAKRRQGPYPVAPLLPLAQFRRPDGSLFVSDEEQVPDSRVPPPQPLESFRWPMLLGGVTVPLLFDGAGGQGAAAAGAVAGAQQQVLEMAMTWLMEGKLHAVPYHTQPPGAVAPQRGSFLWSYERLEQRQLPPLAPGSLPRLTAGGHCLALYVCDKDFTTAALEKFPGAASLERSVWDPVSSARHDNCLRLCATAPAGPLDRLVKLLAVRELRWLNQSLRVGLGINVRLYGPGLDESNGAVLKLDIRDGDPQFYGNAGAADSSSGSDDGDSSDSGDSSSDSDDDADGSGDESDADGAASPPSQPVVGRKRSRSASAPPSASKVGKGAAGKANGKAKAKANSGKDGANGKGKGAGAAGKAAKGPARKRARKGEAPEDQPSPRAKAARGGRGRGRGRGGGRGRGAGGRGGAAAGPSDGAGPSGSAPGAARPRCPVARDGRYHLGLEFILEKAGLEASCPRAPASDLNLHGDEGRTRRIGKGGAEGYARGLAETLCVAVHVLLEAGNGLFVGPDCDGGINTGDFGAAGAGNGGPGARGGAGPSGSAAGGRRSRAGSAAPEADEGPAGDAAAGGCSGSDDEDGNGEAVHNLDSLLDSIQPPPDLPQAMAPPAVVAHPKPFQLQGLEWMLRRERRGDAVGRSLLLLHPGWAQVVVGSSGLVLHVHRLQPAYVTPEFVPAPVGGTCGGFLCDEMGLGKSLQTLMLILSNPPPPGWAAKPVPITAPGAQRIGAAQAPPGGGAAAGPQGGRQRSSSGGSGRGASPAQAGPVFTALLDPQDQEPVPIATTLLVTPANLQEQWVEEIERHLVPGALRWAIYKGREFSLPLKGRAGSAGPGASAADGDAGDGDDASASRRAARAARQAASAVAATAGSGGPKLLPPAMAHGAGGTVVPVHSCDVVFVSYEVLRRELAVGGVKESGKLLPRLGFWRIVLDEAQLVANSNSVAAEVVSSLYRRHAWVVTGTPISSSLNEVQGLCEFLSYEPYYHSPVWRNLLLTPYTHRSAMGVAGLRSLLRGVMLRRSKSAVEDQLALPPCTRVDLPVTLSGVERAFYDVLKGRYLAALAPLRAAAAANAAAAAAGEFARDGPGGSGSAGWSRNSDAARRQQSRGRGGRAAAADDKGPKASYHKAQAALVALRQCCCHPHIVRREADAPGVRGAGGGSGDGRRSMKQIMAKLVSEAYAAYDQAVASLFAARIQATALRDFEGGGDASAGDAGGSAGSFASLMDGARALERSLSGTSAAAAAPAAASGSGGGAAAGPGGCGCGGVVTAMAACRVIGRLVGETDLVAQARARGPDGLILWDRVPATAAYGGAGAGGLAGMSETDAAEQARERRRRWQRLELDCAMLRCYLACLQAPPGTLQLLAARSAARHYTAAQVTAAERAQVAAHNAAVKLAAVPVIAEAAEAELADWRSRDGDARVAAWEENKRKRKRAAGADSDGDDVADEAEGEDRERDNWRDKLGPREKQLLAALKSALSAARAEARAEARARAEAEAAASGTRPGAAALRAAARRAADRAAEAAEPEMAQVAAHYHAALKAMVDTAESDRAAAMAAALAAKMTAAAKRTADELASVAELASPEVLEAANRIQGMNDEVNEIRSKLGLDPVDFMQAETELRRGSRRPGKGGEGAAGAGPSGAAVPRGAAGADDDEWEGEDEDDDDSSDASSDGGRGGPPAKARKRSAGDRQHARRGGRGKGAGGAGGAEGLLQQLGGSAFQEAQFRSEPVIRAFQQLTCRTGQQAAAAAAAAAAGGSERAAATGAAEMARLTTLVREKFGALQHLLHEQESLGLLGAEPAPPAADGAGDAAAAGASGSGAGPSGSSGVPPKPAPAAATPAAPASAAAAQPPSWANVGSPGKAVAAARAKEEFSCPICLDACEKRTITKCGHTYCTDCIHDIVQGKGTAPCPICRRQLTRADLYDSTPDEELALLDAAAAIENAEYGAKVSALLEELSRMASDDPHSKALVFSSWGRLLRLVQEALASNGVRCVSLVGGDPAARQRALAEFLHDPGCRVLLLLKSTSGGAAGLTLTVAHTAFMMEPAVNPGLEAQAAARICRLGQDRPTRVVRILAQDTVEERVLALQQHKQMHGDTSSAAAVAAAAAAGGAAAGAPGAGAPGGGGELVTESVDSSLLLRFFDRL